VHKACLPNEGWKVLRDLSGIVAKYRAVLAGGTALALRLGHRISLDLDFFTDAEFDSEKVISAMRKTRFSFRVLSEAKGSLIMEADGVKTSLLFYEYPFLDKPTLFHKIPIAGLLDIAAMKIIAINQRGTKRDFIDLFFVLQNVPFHKIAEHMVKRFGRERINPVQIGKSLVYFADVEADPDPEYTRGNESDWQMIKTFFRNHVKQFTFDMDICVKKTAHP